jgi:hypothetical protein
MSRGCGFWEAQLAAEASPKDGDLVTQHDDLGLERSLGPKQVAEDPDGQSQHVCRRFRQRFRLHPVRKLLAGKPDAVHRSEDLEQLGLFGAAVSEVFR